MGISVFNHGGSRSLTGTTADSSVSNSALISKYLCLNTAKKRLLIIKKPARSEPAVRGRAHWELVAGSQVCLMPLHVITLSSSVFWALWWKILHAFGCVLLLNSHFLNLNLTCIFCDWLQGANQAPVTFACVDFAFNAHYGVELFSIACVCTFMVEPSRPTAHYPTNTFIFPLKSIFPFGCLM